VKDVKRAYKQQALRYHPDKNTDCDTSCIFTAVQSAYESLLLSAPADPIHEAHEPPPRSAGRRRDPYEELSSKSSPQKPTYHSSFRRPSNPSETSTASAPHPNAPDIAKPHPPESKLDREQASGVAQMSTEQLRRSLRAIGVSLLLLLPLPTEAMQFSRLEGCSREELVKKFLAAKSHFAQQKSSPGERDGSAAKAPSGESGWGEKMQRRMERERQREWRREEAQVLPSSSRLSSLPLSPAEEVQWLQLNTLLRQAILWRRSLSPRPGRPLSCGVEAPLPSEVREPSSLC
jgi:hypothetical protein